MRRKARFVMAGAVLLAVAPGAFAATITVTTLADELNADGDCSLREAVAAANTNAAVDGCAAGTAGADTIIVPAGTIVSSVTILVGEEVTIQGAGRASTSIQRPGSTVLNSSAPSANINLQDMGVVGGVNTLNASITATRVDFSGGQTVNTLGGPITISDVTLAGGSELNSSSGALTLANVAMTGDGGVNTSSGAITMADVTITGGDINTSSGTISLTRVSVLNSGGSSAVNSSTGPITLVDSRVSGGINRGISSSSGAISLTRTLVSGNGDDGVSSGEGTIALVNSTISGNADAGVNGGSTVTLNANASTIIGNGDGGIGALGTMTLVNTIVALNIGGEAGDCDNPVTSSQFSLDSDGSCGLTGTGDRPNINPLLGPLANNGGPTATHLPQPGSPVIDNGSNAACQPTDQRGVARPIDGDGNGAAACDIGAVEAGAGSAPPPPPPPPVAAPTAEIPTLSEWSLLLLSLMLLGLAVPAVRTRRRR